MDLIQYILFNLYSFHSQNGYFFRTASDSSDSKNGGISGGTSIETLWERDLKRLELRISSGWMDETLPTTWDGAETRRK